MYGIILLAGTVIILLGMIFYPGFSRKRILSHPFPQSWQRILEQRLPFFSRLKAAEQLQLKQNIQLFVADKRFYGCGGLEINDDIRVTIAAYACLLLFNRKTSGYGKLRHILVYPHAFKAGHEQRNIDGTIATGKRGLLGESWHDGKVILSWDDVEYGVMDFHDGHNVVLHEFSHQLDSESGSANGAPLLQRNSYKTWTSVLSAEFESLSRNMEGHHHSVMDYYGATNPAEFFAVASETFFEKPLQMADKHPQLFEQLQTYYAVDPRLWVSERPSR